MGTRRFGKPGPAWAAAIACCTLLALVAAGTALAFKPTVVRQDNLILRFNGGTTPTKLPKRTPSPVSLNVASEFATADGTHLPALTEFVLETDKNGFVDAKGLPACSMGKLRARDTKTAEKACRKAIVGRGTTEVEVQFPEQKPIPVHSKLVGFNGGAGGGKTSLLIHAYLTSPVSAAVIIPVEIGKVRNGVYRLRSVAAVPTIAGTSGSIVSFDLTFDRRFEYRGRQKSYISATCSDGHIRALGQAVFANDSRVDGEVVRACTPKG